MRLPKLLFFVNFGMLEAEGFILLYGSYITTINRALQWVFSIFFIFSAIKILFFSSNGYGILFFY